MSEVLILKTAALGDVLRTTSILPGLQATLPETRITWVTAPGAVDLVRTHPLVAEVVAVDARDPASIAAAGARLARTRWTRVISLDDERPLCALAAGLDAEQLSGATLDAAGQRVYTPDVAPWFDMGLLSVHGKQRADELKLRNTRSHPAIYADMLGIPLGKPALHLPAEARATADAFARRHGLDRRRPLVGLNTGAGGRWVSKQLSPERTVELARQLARELPPSAAFLVLGGADEAGRNAQILAGLAAAGLGERAIDAGTHNPLLEFAALVALVDLLVTSDSLALHVSVALGRPVVAFFAPTSAAEIELYGLGEKVLSTASDYCSYRPDARNDSITPERLTAAALRVLGAARGGFKSGAGSPTLPGPG
ncbi:MAG: glycosyltransferase family 9 protein [Planctomycetes bacterium]|nr:glycosyltransferase family 9 protein [Planctomycetota bacterium]